MKRDPIEIVEDIFNVLERGKPLSINELSQATGLHYVTIKKYIKLITMVKEGPDLEVVKTARSVILKARRNK